MLLAIGKTLFSDRLPSVLSLADALLTNICEIVVKPSVPLNVVKEYAIVAARESSSRLYKIYEEEGRPRIYAVPLVISRLSVAQWGRYCSLGY